MTLSIPSHRPGRAPPLGGALLRTGCLQKDVGARPRTDEECRVADKLNGKLRRRIEIGAPLKDPAGISELSGCCKSSAPNVGERLVASRKNIGIDIPQVNLVTLKKAQSLKICDDISVEKPRLALVCRVIVKGVSGE